MTEPREGLPPCVKVVLFDDRLAVLYDRSCSCGQFFDDTPERYCCTAAPHTGYQEATGHPDCMMPSRGPWLLHLDTDDLDEAQAAFERGREYVRTGKLGEAT